MVAIDPNQPGIRWRATTQCLEVKAFLLQLSLLVKPAAKPEAPFPTLEDGGSTVLSQACSHPVEGWWGERRQRLRALWGHGLHQTRRRRRTCHACRWAFHPVVCRQGCHQTRAPPHAMVWLGGRDELAGGLCRACQVTGSSCLIRRQSRLSRRGIFPPHAPERHEAVWGIQWS
jgi:hypothetical protein